MTRFSVLGVISKSPFTVPLKIKPEYMRCREDSRITQKSERFSRRLLIGMQALVHLVPVA
jgi:hypothetical protein